MAVMVTNIWTPNSSGAVPQLTENLIISRDAMRKDGFTADVLALLPGGGGCLLYTSPSPRDLSTSRMPSSA